jgi:hypothetical protein
VSLKLCGRNCGRAFSHMVGCRIGSGRAGSGVPVNEETEETRSFSQKALEYLVDPDNTLTMACQIRDPDNEALRRDSLPSVPENPETRLGNMQFG